VATITEARRKRIFEEEKIRTTARLKASFAPKYVLLYVLFMVIVFSTLFYFDNPSPAKNIESVVSLDNEIQINLMSLKMVEQKDNLFLEHKSKDIDSYYQPINQETLVGSMKWYPERFKSINLKNRIALLQAGVDVLVINHQIHELVDPQSKSSPGKIREALNQEVQAVIAYTKAASLLEKDMEPLLKDLKDSDNLSIAASMKN
jgi:hypothetical protein